MSDPQAPPPPPDAPPPDAPPPPAPPSPPPAGPPGGTGGGGSSNRTMMLVLSYLWPFALLPYLTEKDDKEVQWHAKNGLVLLAAEVLASVVMTAVSFGCLGCVLPLVWLAVLVFHIYCIVQAVDGKRVEIPYLSELTKHL